MATLFSLNDGNLTDPNVFGQTMSAGDFFDGTSNLNITTSYSDPSINIYSITSDGSSISAIAVNVNYRSATPTGTLSMLLSSGGSFVTETYAISSFTSYDDRNNLVSNASQNWQILKLSTPFASTSGNRIRLDFSTSDADQLAFVGTLTAFDNSKGRVGTFNGTFTQSDSPFVNTPLETAYRFSTSKANFENYNDAVFGTGDFTIELWFKLNATGAYMPLLMKGIGYNGGGYPNDWFVDLRSTELWLTRYADVTSEKKFTYTPTVGVWTHLAFCRKNGMLTAFINGTSLNTIADSTNYFNHTNLGIQMGASFMNGAWQYLNGSITNARVVAGKALYLSNFTVPSSPLLLDSGTAIANYKSPTSPTYVSEITPFSGVNAEDGSLFFNGTSDVLRASEVVFGANNFTVELWAYMTSTIAQSQIIGQWSGAVNQSALSWAIETSNDANRFLRILASSNGNTALFDHITTTALPLNTWSHVALTRDTGGVYRIFLNGVLCGNGTVTNNSALFNATNDLTIGATSNSTQFFNGYMSNIRIVNGTALYTSNFAVPTAPLTNITNTALLLKAPYSPLSRNIDYSPTPFTGGNAEPSSLYFNGTSDFLTAPQSSGYDFASGTFTVEAWVRFNDVTGTRTIVTNYSGASNGWTINLASGKLAFYASGDAADITGTATLQANTWYHIAVAGSPGSYKMFLNGVQDGNTFTSSTVLNGGPLYIGKLVAGETDYYFLNGYLSNLRIVNGTALYTSNFAVPTAPLTNITNTVYLLQSPYDQFGMPSIQSPFGVGTDVSVKFNGTSDYLISSESVNFTTGAFTIECWIRSSVTPAAQIIAGNYLNASSGWILGFSTGRLAFWASGDAVDIQGTTTLQANTWYHVAVAGTTGSYKLFLNGIQEGGTYTGSTTLAGGALNIGRGAGSFFNGHISNFRIVNGTALYTANFNTSAPISPLTPLSSVAGTILLIKDAYDTRSLKAYNTPFLLGSYGNVNKGLVTTTTKDPSTFVDYGTLTKTGTTLSAGSPFGVGVDSSIRFNGSTDFITAASSPSFQFNSGIFTVECWVNFSATGSQIFLSTHNTATNGWDLGIFNSRLYFCLTGDGIDAIDTNTISLNTWYHVAFGGSPGLYRLFVNGSVVATYTGATVLNGGDLLIGKYSGGFPFNGFISNVRILDGISLYNNTFTPPTAPLTAITNTSFLYNHPYGNTYSIKNAHNLHVGGSLIGLTSEARVLTASTIEEGDLYVHNQGKLVFPTDSSRTITISGSKGLQITSDGTLEIGTANTPISSTVQHSIVLNNTQIDVHNGGNMNVYGSYKKPFTSLTSDSLSSARTFTAVDAVSTNWSVGDSVVFTPNTFQANSFDVLTLSSFDSGSTFRTTASAAFNHPSVISLGNVPTVSNLSRNISIRGNSSSGRATVRAVDAAKVNIANTQFTNFGIASANKTGFVVGVNSSGYVSLSGNAFNSDGFGGTTHITTISSKPVIGSLTLRDNVFFRSGGNGVSLSSVSASALTVTGNTLLSSNSAGLFFASVSSSGITMSDNTVIGARSNGTVIANSNINGNIGGVNNYRNGNSGLVLSASQCGSLNNLVSIHNVGEGIYVDGSIPGLSNTTFSNITASNNATLGFRVSGNTINHLSPITLSINRLIANDNLSGGFEAYSISGNLSSLELNRNGIYGMRTSIGNAPTTIDGITALMNNVASTSAGIGILSGTNYYPIIIKDAILGGLSGSGISLDSTKFSQFNVFNSTVSGRSSFSVTASRSIVEGSYLISNTNVSNLPVGTGITNSNYQADVLKTTGFAFTNMNNASGYNVTYLAAGSRAVDSTLNGNISASTSPSERLTPQSTTLKLRSGSKFVALSAGESTRISVYMRKSSVATNGVAYNGTSPRLILKRNAAMGIATDIVVDQLDTTSEIFLKLSGVSPAVSDTGVLEFYVDCDGTTGWINIDNWSAT